MYHNIDFKLVLILNKAGVESITVHGSNTTARQFGFRLCDYLEEELNNIERRIQLYNGDNCSFEN